MKIFTISILPLDPADISVSREGLKLGYSWRWLERLATGFAENNGESDGAIGMFDHEMDIAVDKAKRAKIISWYHERDDQAQSRKAAKAMETKALNLMAADGLKAEKGGRKKGKNTKWFSIEKKTSK